jgi:hypothetical protein
MSEQGVRHPVDTSFERGLQGQLLVRGHMRDQARVQRLDRVDRQGLGAGRGDAGRYLDHRLGGQERQPVAVADVDDLHVTAIRGQGRHEVDRGFGVVRAAALLQQFRLLLQRRVGVHLEQAFLDGRHLLGAGRRGELFGHHRVVFVEVAQVIGRYDTEAPQEGRRQTDAGREVLGVLGEQSGQDVLTADVHAALPGQMVEADMPEPDVAGSHPQCVGEAPLETDRHVAQTDGAVPGVEQRPRDDADRVGEVDDPRVRGQLGDPAGDVQDNRHRAQRLGEPARAGRLLPHAAACQRQRLVHVPGGLSTDA